MSVGSGALAVASKGRATSLTGAGFARYLPRRYPACPNVANFRGGSAAPLPRNSASDVTDRRPGRPARRARKSGGEPPHSKARFAREQAKLGRFAAPASRGRFGVRRLGAALSALYSGRRRRFWRPSRGRRLGGVLCGRPMAFHASFCLHSHGCAMRSAGKNEGYSVVLLRSRSTCFRPSGVNSGDWQ